MYGQITVIEKKKNKCKNICEMCITHINHYCINISIVKRIRAKAWIRRPNGFELEPLVPISKILLAEPSAKRVGAPRPHEVYVPVPSLIAAERNRDRESSPDVEKIRVVVLTSSRLVTGIWDRKQEEVLDRPRDSLLTNWHRLDVDPTREFQD